MDSEAIGIEIFPIGKKTAKRNNTPKELENSDSSSETKKLKSKRVTKACVFCQKWHLSCEEARPCKKCIEKGIGGLCTDGITKRRGRKRKISPEQVLKEMNNQNSSPSSPSDSSPTSISPSMTHMQLSDVCSENQMLDLPQNLINEFLFSAVEEIGGLIDWQDLNNNCCIPEKSVHLKHFEEGTPEKNETPSLVTRSEWFSCFTEYLKSRLPLPQLDVFLNHMTKVRNEVAKLRESLTREIVDTILSSFESTLVTYSSVFEDMAIPTIIWEKCGVIHFANKAYRDLTGFSLETPTTRANFEFFNQLTDDTFKSFLQKFHGIMLSDSTSFSLTADIKCKQENKFIEVVMYSTIKRDIIGMPLLFIGNLVPKDVPREPFCVESWKNSFVKVSTHKLAKIKEFVKKHGLDRQS